MTWAPLAQPTSRKLPSRSTAWQRWPRWARQAAAGTDKPVQVSGISLSESDAGNYSVNTTASTSARNVIAGT